MRLYHSLQTRACTHIYNKTGKQDGGGGVWILKSVRCLIEFVRCEVLTVVLVKIRVLWEVSWSVLPTFRRIVMLGSSISNSPITSYIFKYVMFIIFF
jgi:hypothetical protein